MCSLRWRAWLVVLIFANDASAAPPRTSIDTWTGLKATIGAAAGKKVTITLSTPFMMADFKEGSCIKIEADNTDITIAGNGAVFDAGKMDRFFYVARVLSTTLVISNVTMQNGNYTYAFPPGRRRHLCRWSCSSFVDTLHLQSQRCGGLCGRHLLR
jgi:hypothetical protein